MTQTLTFLFTDIVGSTVLWERAPAAMTAALQRHDEILHDSIEASSGEVFATMGDGVAVAFTRASDALTAALSIQAAITGESWSPDATIEVRIGLHTGEAVERSGDYFGPAVNRAARVMSLARGRQILLSAPTVGVLPRSATGLEPHRTWQPTPEGCPSTPSVPIAAR